MKNIIKYQGLTSFIINVIATIVGNMYVMFWPIKAIIDIIVNNMSVYGYFSDCTGRLQVVILTSVLSMFSVFVTIIVWKDEYFYANMHAHRK